MSGTATYVYCVVHRARKPATSRIPAGVPEASPPDVVELTSGLWLVCADVALSMYSADQIEGRLRNLDWVSRVALAHEAVVARFSRVPDASVIPMKLFTMFSSRSRAVEDLRARRPQLEAVVGRIRGSEEWGVRIARKAPRAGTRTRVPKRASSGAAFLAAKKRSRDDARAQFAAAAEAAERALTALAALAKQTRRHTAPEGAAAPPLVEAAFLVPTSRKARFRMAATRAAERCRSAGADLTLTGPWPPYNFVQVDDTQP